MGSSKKMVVLQIENDSDPGTYRNHSEHEKYDDAMKEMFRLYDSGHELFYKLEFPDGGWSIYAPWQLQKVECPACGKEVRTFDMEQTYDCQGIPYRKVCHKCKRRIEATVGYDGQYYTEADECLDEEY